MRTGLLLLFSLAILPLLAQRPAITGSVQGRVLDGSTNGPAEFAAVTVFALNTDSLLGGAMVQANGDFRVERLPMGQHRIRVAFMGYATLEERFVLTPAAPERDMGNLRLLHDETVLREAEVVRERATTMMQVDRRVFNVDKDLSAQGGSAVDVMKNVPGLSVDVDGNVALRGSSPMVLIDGRPTTMTLEDIPASDIERVEVITNPSVAFDAGTSGGIINVVLKKNNRAGYFGNVQLGVGTNDRYQGGLTLNMRDGKWGFALSYNYSTGRNKTDARTDRTDLLNGENIGSFFQETQANGVRMRHGGRLGIDYQLNNRTTLTFAQSARGRAMENSDRQLFSGSSGSGWQLNEETNDNISLTSQFGIRRTSPKEGKEWSADVTYNRWERSSEASFLSNTFVGDAHAPFSPRLQANDGGANLDQISAQFDAVDPLNERTRLEYGFKTDQTLDNTWINVRFSSPLIGESVLDTGMTNDYRITTSINAAYANLSHRINEKWSVQGGLRFEHTYYNVELRGKDRDFGYQYPNGLDNLAKALFPAAYLVRRWDNKRELQINFSRKISRPRFWQIMPVLVSSDVRNARIGDPGLAPELSNLAEVNHLLPFLDGKASWFTSVFGRYTEDVITNYSAPMASDSSILLSTFVNGASSYGGGWENILKFEPQQGTQITLSTLLQYTDIGLGSGQGALRNRGFNYELKAMIGHRFHKDLMVQVNGGYEGPRIIPQGRTLSQYGVDISASYDIRKNLSAVLAVNDVFYTRRWGQVLDTPFLLQESYRRWEMRNVRLTVTWKFGQQDASLFRRKQAPRREPGGDGMEEGF